MAKKHCFVYIAPIRALPCTYIHNLKKIYQKTLAITPIRFAFNEYQLHQMLVNTTQIKCTGKNGYKGIDVSATRHLYQAVLRCKISVF